jgi:Tol biopolymer transport system component
VEPEPPNRISDLYHQAVDRAPGERSAFLREACAGDEALRREVESLLSYDEVSSSFLERPAGFVAGDMPGAAHGMTMINRQLGPYTILEPLGAGGMGEVYRARDSKLGRDVAIKILPSHFTEDPERRSRFAREARLLATLDHPHIGAIHGLEEIDGVSALVLELVEGPTLAERLERGPLPVSEAIVIARQIAEALDAAHQKGVVHRDLKPANIVLKKSTDPTSSEVSAKVLDFGLAKLIATDGSAGDASSHDGTMTGRILGTPAYMSPEQARGLGIDKRTDIWAFGCVVFETLTGRRAFEGDTVTDTLAHVLDREPDWTTLPAATPASIRTLLERSLRKDPRKRLRDIADALIEIDEVPAAVARSSPRAWLGWFVAAILGLASVAGLYLRPVPTVMGPIEIPVGPPENWLLSAELAGHGFEISPDGTSLVMSTFSQGVWMLWIRPVANASWRQIPGTHRSSGPFWSPDSQSLGFFANGQLQTIDVTGGSRKVLCQVPAGANGAWSSQGVILFGSTGPLMRVNKSGGTPVPATTLKGTDTAHLWPAFLDDGNHFLFLAETQTTSDLRLGSLTSSDTVSFGPFESNAVYAGGYLLFVRKGQLVAQPFAADSHQLKGNPLILAEQTAISQPSRRGYFSVSATGVVAYRRTGRAIVQLTWMDRNGTEVGKAGQPGFYNNLSLSRDGRYVAVSQLTEPPGMPWNRDIWQIDLARDGAAERLTTDPAGEFDPAWSVDGTRIAFTSGGADGGRLFVRSRASQKDGDELLKAPGHTVAAPDWSPDGNWLLYTQFPPGYTRLDVRLVRLADRSTSVFSYGPFSESSGTFSPSGRWVAFESDQTGRREIYVRPFPMQERQLPVSRDGGRAPRWSHHGRELFFLGLDGWLMSATIDTSRSPDATLLTRLFQTNLHHAPNDFNPYAVAKDGRFLIPVVLNPQGPTPITVLLNWPAALHK